MSQLTTEHCDCLHNYHKQMHQFLENCQQEVVRLKAERNLYEENMKKAFMRGVCALNMEAMSMFQHHEDGSVDQQLHHTDSGERQLLSNPPHINADSNEEIEPPPSQCFHPDIPATQLTCSQAQSKLGSKCVYVITSGAAVRAGPSPSQGGNVTRSRLGQMSSNSSKKTSRTNRLVPAVVVEKH